MYYTVHTNFQVHLQFETLQYILLKIPFTMLLVALRRISCYNFHAEDEKVTGTMAIYYTTSIYSVSNR